MFKVFHIQKYIYTFNRQASLFLQLWADFHDLCVLRKQFRVYLHYSFRFLEYKYFHAIFLNNFQFFTSAPPALCTNFYDHLEQFSCTFAIRFQIFKLQNIIFNFQRFSIFCRQHSSGSYVPISTIHALFKSNICVELQYGFPFLN